MEDSIKIAGIIEDSIVDGPGIRFVIFTQGCPHNCKGCHNPQTHDFNSGVYEKIDDILAKINENPIIKGITISGGEPFMQAKKLSLLIDRLENKNLDIITYSGFTYEEILNNANIENGYMEFLKKIDILVDGRFEIEKKNENLNFRGSTNQRVIDVKESLKNKKIIECEF